MSIASASAFAGAPAGLLAVAVVSFLFAFLAWGTGYIYRDRPDDGPSLPPVQRVSDAYFRGRGRMFRPLLLVGVAALVAALVIALIRAM